VIQRGLAGLVDGEHFFISPGPGQSVEPTVERPQERWWPLAIGLVALMYGGLSLSRAVRGTELSDEILRACRALGIAAARRER
jgi:hypothetical protein